MVVKKFMEIGKKKVERIIREYLEIDKKNLYQEYLWEKMVKI